MKISRFRLFLERWGIIKRVRKYDYITLTRPRFNIKELMDKDLLVEPSDEDLERWANEIRAEVDRKVLEHVYYGIGYNTIGKGEGDGNR